MIHGNLGVEFVGQSHYSVDNIVENIPLIRRQMHAYCISMVIKYNVATIKAISANETNNLCSHRRSVQAAE